jgi:hypothetical protein
MFLLVQEFHPNSATSTDINLFLREPLKTMRSAHCYTSKCYFGHHLSNLVAKCDVHVLLCTLKDTVKSAYDKTFLTLSADIK